MEHLEQKTTQLERHDINNTPFTIMKNVDTKECIITCGPYKISEMTFLNEKAATMYINKKPWELLVNMMGLMAEQVNKINNSKTQNHD